MDLCWEQREYPTLKHTYEQLACVDVVVVDAQRAKQWSHFKLIELSWPLRPRLPGPSYWSQGAISELYSDWLMLSWQPTI